MPRSGKGGARQGAPQAAYANRTDLNAAKPEPITTAPGQGYGVAAEQQAAQRAMPIAPQPVATASPPGGPPAAPSPPPALGGTPTISPGEINLFGPTARPSEPVTHGLPVGPGAGPEALSGIGAVATAANAEQGTVGAFLSHLAAQPGTTSSVRDLAQLVGAGQAV